jgi:hypothetical protein
MSLLDNPADTIYVSGSIFDTETVITISDELLSNVFSVNGQVGNVIINTGSFITGVDLSSYATITNLALTGSGLQSQINNLDLNYASDLQLSQTGLALNTKIDNLSGVSVLTYGNQTIGGIKTFRDTVYIGNLYVTGVETIVNTQNFNVQSPYLLLNLTGGATDGGIFFVTGSGFTGINEYGPIIGFDHSNKFKFGVARRSDDLSALNDIQAALETREHSFYSTSTHTLAHGRNVQLNVSMPANGATGTIVLPRLTTDSAQNGDDLVIVATGFGSGQTLIIERYIWTGSSYINSKTTVVTTTTNGSWRFRLLFGVWQLQPVATHTHPSTDISDSTTAGRALLTGADAAAQRTSLGLGTAATSASTDFYSSNNPSGFIGGDLGTNGKLLVSDNSYGDELGILTDNDEVLAAKMSDGSFQYGGGFPNVKPPISVLNGNVSFYNTGGNSAYDNPFLTIDNGINKIRFGIQPQDPNAVSPLDDAGFIFDGDPGNQYILEFLNGAAGNPGGKITFNKTGYVAYQQDLSNFANGNLSVGIYNYKASQYYESKYLKQESTINAREQTSPVSGIKNDDIVNLYFSRATAGLTDPIDNGVNSTHSRTLKVNPGILVDHNGAASSRNLIKFDDATQYSGKAIRKVRYNSTIGNGYERILLSADSDDVDNCPIIRPKTRRIETFYDINVPSGGGTTRYFLFRTPTSFPFAQAACMNLRFNFEADSSPCVISGLVYGTNEHVLTLSGANYSFVQKERVILISKGDGGNTAEFKHW